MVAKMNKRRISKRVTERLVCHAIMINASCWGSDYLGLIRSLHTQNVQENEAYYALAEMTLTLLMLWLR